jgi:hypothetical protein
LLCCFRAPAFWVPPRQDGGRVQAKPPIEPDEPVEPPESWQPDLAYRLAAWREAAPGEHDHALPRTFPEKWWARAPPPLQAEHEVAAAGGLTAGCLALAPGEEEYGRDQVLVEATLAVEDFNDNPPAEAAAARA